MSTSDEGCTVFVHATLVAVASSVGVEFVMFPAPWSYEMSTACPKAALVVYVMVNWFSAVLAILDTVHGAPANRAVNPAMLDVGSMGGTTALRVTTI